MYDKLYKMYYAFNVQLCIALDLHYVQIYFIIT